MSIEELQQHIASLEGTARASWREAAEKRKELQAICEHPMALLVIVRNRHSPDELRCTRCGVTQRPREEA